MTETQKVEVLAEANRLRHAAETADLRRENQILRDHLYDRFAIFVTNLNPTQKMKRKLKVIMQTRSLTVAALIGVAAIGLATISTGCATQQATTTAYKAEATTDAAVTTAMSAWGTYVAAYHPTASQELEVEKAFDAYQQAELAAIDATAAYANAAGSNSVAQAQNETTALNSATQSLTDLLNLAAQFEAITNK
jgi:hypothetical protein